jgi:hypothetical protein
VGLNDLLFDLEKTGNLIEACFWIVFGLGLAVWAMRRGRASARLGLLLAFLLIVFGISDLVEAYTGAWWRPWWLLVWKGICFSGMVLCTLKYRQIKSRAVASKMASPDVSTSST